MEPYSEMLTHDVQTMPAADPAVEERLAKEMAKAQKTREVEAKKQRAEMKKVPGQREPPPKKEASAGLDKAAQKRELKSHKIRLYFSKLGHKLTIKEPKSYPRTDEGLDELLTAIETELHSNGGIEKATMMYASAVTGVEQLMPVFNPLGWQLSGPAASLSQTVIASRDQWEELVTEFAISNAEWCKYQTLKFRYSVFNFLSHGRSRQATHRHHGAAHIGSGQCQQNGKCATATGTRRSQGKERGFINSACSRSALAAQYSSRARTTAHTTHACDDRQTQVKWCHALGNGEHLARWAPVHSGCTHRLLGRLRWHPLPDAYPRSASQHLLQSCYHLGQTHSTIPCAWADQHSCWGSE